MENRKGEERVEKIHPIYCCTKSITRRRTMCGGIERMYCAGYIWMGNNSKIEDRIRRRFSIGWLMIKG